MVNSLLDKVKSSIFSISLVLMFWYISFKFLGFIFEKILADLFPTIIFELNIIFILSIFFVLLPISILLAHHILNKKH